MQTYQAAIGKPTATEILSTPPRTGHFSIYGQRLSAQVFVWVASFVVWGNVVNETVIRRNCAVHCAIQLIFGVLTWVGASVVLMNRPPRFGGKPGMRRRCCSGGCLSPSFETQFSCLLIIFWIPLITSVSMYNAAPIIVTWFAWLGFFASIYATYKCFHSEKEDEMLFETQDDDDGFDSQGLLSSSKSSDILARTPFTGHISVYAQKLSAQVFIWLASITVWGNIANDASIRLMCNTQCGFQVAFGVLTWILASIILLFNLLAERNEERWRTGFFSHGVEAQLTGLLVLLWMPVVISVSTYNSAPMVATWFTWLGFFGSIYATYKAYHTFKEEDLPSDLPDGFDEEGYVYG